VIACVGDGHVPGMTRLLEDSSIETHSIRLKELKVKKRSPADVSSASFHVNYSTM
jgi:hypothetical protein